VIAAIVRPLAVALLLGAVTLGGATMARADSAYRYWSYWIGKVGAWDYSRLGPANLEVQDGDVQGWRFGVSSGEATQSPAPRTDPADLFTYICGSTPEVAGSVRVAIVLDPGSPTIAPAGQTPPEPRPACATVPEGATGAQALSSVAELRVESGFVCAIDGYPTGECAPSVDVTEDGESEVDVIRSVDTGNPQGTESPTTASESAESESTGGPWLTLLVIAIAIIIAAVAWMVSRRRTR
jgi:hypothetical protein